MKAVIHATGAIGEVLGIERRDDGNDYVYFQSGLCKPISEVGFLNPYEQYEEDCYDWADFRREAAKAAMQGILASGDDGWSLTLAEGYKPEEKHSYPIGIARFAIACADELIKQLKEEKK